VTNVFSKVLSLPTYKIEPEAIWNVDLGGDSMSYIEMCQRLNAEFEIEIPEELYGVLGTVNDFAKQVLEMTKDRQPSEKKKKHASHKKKNG
jgi:acyl carrier protein